MRIGFVGVRDGRLVRRLAAAGVRVFACWTDDLAGDARIALLSDAVAVARALAAPRVVWRRWPSSPLPSQRRPARRSRHATMHRRLSLTQRVS